jgi:hypothetical protein
VHDAGSACYLSPLYRQDATRPPTVIEDARGRARTTLAVVQRAIAD